MREYAILLPDGTIEQTNDVKKAFGDNVDRFIKQEFFKDHFVSTVFLPLNHAFADGPSLHFETYVFRSTRREVKNWLERWGERCHTKEEALKAHQRAKDWCRGKK